MQKKVQGLGFGSGGGGRVLGVQMDKWGGRVGGGGQGGCERRIKVFVKIKKNIFGGGGRFGSGAGEGVAGVRVDVKEELKLVWKCKKKSGGGGCQVWPGMGGGRGLGVGRFGGGWLAAMFGVGTAVGYGGCEPRIESIVQCTA